MASDLKELVKQIVTEELTKKRLKSYLHSYVSKNDAQQLEDNIDDILSASKENNFNAILKSNAKYAYRVIDFNSVAQLKKILTSGKDDYDKEKYHTVKNPSLKPSQGEISSWTTNPRSLIYSGFLDVVDKKNLIIFKAKINKNKFFGNPDTLAYYAGEDIGYSLERETLGYGPIECEKAVFGFKQNGQSLEGLALDLINKLVDLGDLDFTSDYYLPKKFKT